MKNPHLVPTTIINKNGVRTTVHRKPSKSASSASTIPAPGSVQSSSGNYAEWINERLTRATGVSDATMLNASKSFFDEELGSLSKRILDSGTATGQRLVAEFLSFYVGRMAEALERQGVTSLPTMNSGSFIHGEIIRRWNYGNIREEANLTPETITDDDLKDFRHTHGMVTMMPCTFNDLPEEQYRTMTDDVEAHWRGVAILSLSFNFDTESEEDDDELAKLNDFIFWAAHRKDVGSVISAVSRHQTVDPSKLEHILEGEESGVHGSMIEGWI